MKFAKTKTYRVLAFAVIIAAITTYVWVTNSCSTKDKQTYTFDRLLEQKEESRQPHLKESEIESAKEDIQPESQSVRQPEPTLTIPVFESPDFSQLSLLSVVRVIDGDTLNHGMLNGPGLSWMPDDGIIDGALRAGRAPVLVHVKEDLPLYHRSKRKETTHR